MFRSGAMTGKRLSSQIYVSSSQVVDGGTHQSKQSMVDGDGGSSSVPALLPSNCRGFSSLRSSTSISTFPAGSQQGYNNETRQLSTQHNRTASMSCGAAMRPSQQPSTSSCNNNTLQHPVQTTNTQQQAPSTSTGATLRALRERSATKSAVIIPYSAGQLQPQNQQQQQRSQNPSSNDVLEGIQRTVDEQRDSIQMLYVVVQQVLEIVKPLQQTVGQVQREQASIRENVTECMMRLTEVGGTMAGIDNQVASLKEVHESTRVEQRQLLSQQRVRLSRSVCTFSTPCVDQAQAQATRNLSASPDGNSHHHHKQARQESSTSAQLPPPSHYTNALHEDCRPPTAISSLSPHSAQLRVPPVVPGPVTPPERDQSGLDPVGPHDEGTCTVVKEEYDFMSLTAARQNAVQSTKVARGAQCTDSGRHNRSHSHAKGRNSRRPVTSRTQSNDKKLAKRTRQESPATTDRRSRKKKRNVVLIDFDKDGDDGYDPWADITWMSKSP